MPAAATIDCRLLAAAHCAYSINSTTGQYSPPEYFNDAVGWNAGYPIPINSGQSDANINACLVGVNTDGILIAFRGTLSTGENEQSVCDWAHDFMAEPETVPDIPGMVHSGFWDDLNSIWSDITQAVQTMAAANPGARLYITGHSKGGALAVIAAACLYFTPNTGLPVPTAVYTFAAPHAGDATFASNFPLATIPVTPYENYLDIIPFLPPTPGFFEVLAAIPDVPQSVKNFLQDGANWDYSALDTTYYYIQKDRTVVQNTAILTVERATEIIGQILILNFGAFVTAHSTACGSGYMSGVCPTLQCSGSTPA